MEKTFLLQKDSSKTYCKKTQGITLIALVVTIVVLLILASVTISTIFSDNGIIKKAQEAANKTKEAVEQEQAELNQLYNDLASIMNNTTGGSTEEPEPEPEPELPSDGSYSEEKGVNTPNLGEGMTAIKWDETANDGAGDWVETEGSDPDWYNYENKEWANAKTADGSIWVWIPRYAYSIPSAGYHKSTATEISIEFMKGTRNETTSGRTSFNNASGQGNWNIHPAFNYGQTVSGIWVSKFEASQSDASTSSMGSSGEIKVQPGVQSWRMIGVNDVYTICLNYNKTLNSHMMKNDEWGAVAYLSRSKYGKNDEVTINSNSSYYTGGGSGNTYVNNGAQSTTGNVWGVYDMSGGSWEYVAAYVNNGNTNLTWYGASLVNSSDARTKNVYTTASTDNAANNYDQNKEVYGDAVFESSAAGARASAWDGDWSCFTYTTVPFFVRGGSYELGSQAGLFCFNACNGGYGHEFSFRPVLVAN